MDPPLDDEVSQCGIFVVGICKILINLFLNFEKSIGPPPLSKKCCGACFAARAFFFSFSNSSIKHHLLPLFRACGLFEESLKLTRMYLEKSQRRLMKI